DIRCVQASRLESTRAGDRLPRDGGGREKSHPFGTCEQGVNFLPLNTRDSRGVGIATSVFTSIFVPSQSKRRLLWRHVSYPRRQPCRPGRSAISWPRRIGVQLEWRASAGGKRLTCGTK